MRRVQKKSTRAAARDYRPLPDDLKAVVGCHPQRAVVSGDRNDSGNLFPARNLP